jgi:histidyl-tRNA synthetase
MSTDSSISTKPYKGVRDFYPDDKRRHNYLLDSMADTAERFGYEQIDASVLERAELYDAKSGNELAQEQSYRFTDRGDREVMLRPEMTPTTARLLAKKHKSVSFPVRWYSLPNLFRYERPQHGRLREHWQLNADIFGLSSLFADVEIISLAAETLQSFGASKDDYEIRVSSRDLFAAFCSQTLSDQSNQTDLARLIDKKDKIGEDKFTDALQDLLPNDEVAAVQNYLDTSSLDELLGQSEDMDTAAQRLQNILQSLSTQQISNAVFTPGLVRGLDYYTGMVFEIFDTSDDNPRALCGGGRYDNLMSMFDETQIPAVGFGFGDVTLADFLDTHNLWPELSKSLDIGVILVDRQKHADYGYKVARKLRGQNLRVAVDISGANVGTQIKQADKSGAENIVIIGDEEKDNRRVTVKTLATGKETTVQLNDLDSLWA